MNFKEATEALIEFQDKFGAGHKVVPSLVDNEKGMLRHSLMAEENTEYIEACKAGDLVEVADALGDMLYVLTGTIVEHGMQDIMPKVFREIHASNMSKLNARSNPLINGKNGIKDETRPVGKILKFRGRNYHPPRLDKIVSKGVMRAKTEQSHMIFEIIQQIDFILQTRSESEGINNSLLTDVDDVDKLKKQRKKYSEKLAEYAYTKEEAQNL